MTSDWLIGACARCQTKRFGVFTNGTKPLVILVMDDPLAPASTMFLSREISGDSQAVSD